MIKKHYTITLLVSLYLAQGLPIGFITQALPAILREYNVSLTDIGWTGALLAPWGLKFLWAPLVDRYYSSKIGQSKSWILPLQLLIAVLLLAITTINPEQLVDTNTLKILFIILFVINVFGATHDVAADALTTRTLNKNNFSLGSSIQVGGYRIGLIIGGGVFLMLIDTLGWQISFVALSLLVLLNTLPIMIHKESDWQPTHDQCQVNNETPPQKNWLSHQFGYFWQSKEMLAWLVVLATYKICDGLSSGMVKPMMTDMGVSLQKIGLWGSVLGSVASLTGAVVAGLLMKKISRVQALIAFNILQAITTFGYAILAYQYETKIAFNIHWIFFVNALEHFMSAMAMVAMLSSIMAYARTKSAGSDFTFQVCLLTFFSGNAHILSGYVADNIGYTALFTISSAIGLSLLISVYWWQKIQSLELQKISYQ